MKFPIVFVGVFIAIIFISESHADDAEQGPESPEGYGKIKLNFISIFLKRNGTTKTVFPKMN